MARSGSKSEGIGARVERKEDARFLRGRGTYVGDISLPRMREVAFLRSQVAHARIRAITKPANSSDSAFVFDDLENVISPECKLGLPAFKGSRYPPLANQKIRFVGEPIAICVAATRAAAEDLAEEIELDLEELPAVVDARAALDRPHSLVHEHWGDNIFLSTEMDNGIAAVQKSAAVSVTGHFRTGRQVMNPLECKAVLAHWDERANQLVVYTSTQVPHLIRSALSEFLGIDQAQVRVIAPDVGGGFGYKCVLQPEELCIAWLALKFRRPFRWIEDRREHLISGANCRDHFYTLTAHADAQGKLLGIDADIVVDAGAYSVWPFTSCLEGTMAANHLPGPYKFDGYRARMNSVATNKPPVIPVSRCCASQHLLCDGADHRRDRAQGRP